MKKVLLPVIAETSDQKLCPSFSPRKPGTGWVFGAVVEGENGPEMIPLAKPEPVTEETFELTAPFHPSEMLRITAPCVESGCKNFGEGICHLAKKSASTPTQTRDLPICRIRSECLWWEQEGANACMRCNKMVTNNDRSRRLRDEMGR